MELRVNDYVRTLDGISRVVECKNNRFVNEDGNVYFYNDMMCNSSPTIIDLIEENDFINGLRVEKNKYGELYTSYVYYGGDIGKQCEVYTTCLKEYREDMIENIVTHEQFENISYKVGD